MHKYSCGNCFMKPNNLSRAFRQKLKLSMGRLDYARTRKCKPEPANASPNPAQTRK